MKHNVMGLCAVACACLLAVPAAAFDIAKNGRARAMIVTGEEPSVVVSGMATELAKYLQEMTGAEFTIAEKKKGGLGAIRLVIEKPGKMSDESFTIKDVKRNNELVITGADERGLVYGIYGFLERQGCRFWAPDQETVPKKPTFVIPAGYDVADAPAFTYRNGTWSQPARESPYYCRKIGMNQTAVQRGTRPPELGPDKHVDISHSIGWKRRFINQDKYFKDHPDWYALRFIAGGVKGKSDRYVIKGGEGKTPETQLKALWKKKYNNGKGGDLIRSRVHVCTSHPEMTKTLIEEVRAYLRADPTRDSVAIAADDDNSFCQCARCDAYIRANGNQLSSGYLNLANQVAWAIRDEFPKVKVYVMAYWATETPPYLGKEVPKAYKDALAPNLAVCLAFGMYRGPYSPVVQDKRLMRTFDGWKRLVSDVLIWGYYASYANFLYPNNDIFNLEADMKGYHERGVRQIYAQLAFGKLADFCDLRAWLFGKLTWNPNQDSNALIKEWVDGTCGKGAPYVNQYLDLRRAEKARNLKERKRNVINADELLKSYLLFQQALDATKDEPAAYARVERLSAGLIALLTRDTYPVFERAAKAAQVKIPTQMEFVDQLEGLFAKYKCSWVAEMRGAKEYLRIVRNDIRKKEKKAQK